MGSVASQAFREATDTTVAPAGFLPRSVVFRSHRPARFQPVAIRAPGTCFPGAPSDRVDAMTVGFSGDVAEYYAKFRRGYPPQVLDALQGAFELTTDDIVLDLGCGTGQLAVPLASRVGSVIGMDPEPDMLRLARDAAARHGVRNANWVLGADTDVPALGELMGRRSLAMTVIGQALHWMRHGELFRALSPLIRPGGGIAVIANGTPLWLQDNDWSRSLRSCLEDYFGTRLEASCGTGASDRLRYAQALEAAGFEDVREILIEYSDELTFDQLVGGVCSAIPADELPGPEARPAFAERIRRSLPPGRYFTEEVVVSVLVGRNR
ncbi:Ubiquinone/menaquinone biosynthesis C-methylase UbiE [Streptomyces pini]|uniref:Ubiquinone/menaquinone biosynthesis C-methylase UbiE n=2 Tax=Streptomyces pini TaxID=1520580 RepID=A0A1I3TY89_9ACTN|nr:Ubiquinone/menaquinone biosynthesis C-methylase UbiE [Streptomyces pini]